MSVRVRVYFEKGERARFLSHLDLAAVMEHAVRRARLPVAISAGFNPHPRISIAAALGLGHLGKREILEIDLREVVDADEVAARLQQVLPVGLTVQGAVLLPEGAKSAGSLLDVAEYTIRIAAPQPDLAARAEALLQRDRIEVTEERTEGTRTRDLRPALLDLTVDDDCQGLWMKVSMGNAGSIRPEQILDVLDLPREGARVSRTEIRLRDQ